MNPNRFFATFVSGLLVIDESRFDEAYALVAQLSALDQVEVQRGTGAGSEDKLALRQWILEQRAKEVLSVSIGVEDGSVATGHDHAGWDRLRQMLAGFADGLPILMRVDTAGEGAVLVQGTVPGPRLSLTSSQFLELLDGQDQRGFFQPGVLDEINAYRTESQRDDIAPAALASYLVSPEGQRDWEVVGRQVFRTVQADALTHEWHFLIPTSFMHHIEKTVPDDDEELEFTAWLEAYDEDDVTGPALLRLIKAQNFAGRIWRIAASRKLLVEKLGDIDELDDVPRIAAQDWPRFLSRLADQDVDRVSAVLIERVRLECEERGIQPRIPDDLAGIFGPDDDERRWLDINERLDHDLGWTIRDTHVSWTLFVRDRVTHPLPSTPSMPRAQARQQFIDALTQARDFAWRADSPYERVLGVARHLAMHAIGPGPLDMNALASPDLMWEPEMLLMLRLFTQTFAPFEWGADRLLGLAAVSTADLFGGMNAWTDQAFEGEEEVRFQAVSLTLFGALNRYYEALVSSGA